MRKRKSRLVEKSWREGVKVRREEMEGEGEGKEGRIAVCGWCRVKRVRKESSVVRREEAVWK